MVHIGQQQCPDSQHPHGSGKVFLLELYLLIGALETQQSSFPDEGLNRCTGQTLKATSQLVEINVGSQCNASKIQLQDLQDVRFRWRVHGNVFFQSSWSKKSRIEAVQSVRACHNEDMPLLIHAIHLVQQGRQ